MATAFGVTGFFIIPETMAPRLLHKKAKKLRFETRNWALHSKLDEEKVSIKQLAQNYILKPFTMLALEPILVLGTYAFHCAIPCLTAEWA